MKNISLRRRHTSCTSCDRLDRLYSCHRNSDGMGETHQSLINFVVSTRLWGLSFNGLKKHPGVIFITCYSNGTGAISKMILWPVLSLVSTLCWLFSDWWRNFFFLLRAQLFTGKLVSQEISNFLPPSSKCKQSPE